MIELLIYLQSFFNNYAENVHVYLLIKTKLKIIAKKSIINFYVQQEIRCKI